MKASDSFPYKPKIDYGSISPRDSKKVIPLLKPFIKDEQFYIESHLTAAEALQKYINSASQVSSDIRATFLNNLKDIEKYISEIMLICLNLRKDLGNDLLRQKAIKEYYEKFSDSFIDEKKIDYIKLLKLYETTKFYNDQLRTNWERLKGFFGNIEIASYNHTFFQQVLTFKIYPRLDLTTQVSLFLRRLSFILQITSEKESSTQIRAQGIYSPTIKYSFSVIFNSKISETIDQLDKAQTKPEDDKKIEKADSVDKEKPEVKEGSKGITKNWDEIKESCIKDSFFIDCRGDEIFNQSYLHTLRIDPSKLESEEMKIQKSVYIETRLGIEEKTFRRELIRSFVSNKDAQDKIDKYKKFLDDFFSLKLTSFMVHFSNMPDNKKMVFMYHFGPVFFLKLVLNEMKQTKSGFIHRFLKNNQMLRELPFEYLKKTLGQWWDENIFQKTNRIQRNSKETYTHFIQMMATSWRKEQPILLRKIAEDPQAKRAFHLHKLDLIVPYIISEISYMFYLIYNRFLGSDFIYIQAYQNTVQHAKKYKRVKAVGREKTFVSH